MIQSSTGYNYQTRKTQQRRLERELAKGEKLLTVRNNWNGKIMIYRGANVSDPIMWDQIEEHIALGLWDIAGAQLEIYVEGDETGAPKHAINN